MALVDDHEVEAVRRVVLLEEGHGCGLPPPQPLPGAGSGRPCPRPVPVRVGGRVALRPVDAQRLVRRYEHAGVHLRVPARDRGRIRPEDVLERPERLVAQLVPIDEEERPAQQPGVREAAQEVDRDVRLAGARRERQQRAVSPRAMFSSTARIAASW